MTVGAGVDGVGGAAGGFAGGAAGAGGPLGGGIDSAGGVGVAAGAGFSTSDDCDPKIPSSRSFGVGIAGAPGGDGTPGSVTSG